MKFLASSLFIFILSITQANALMRALNTAASGMTSQDAQISTISNNIANANTTGFKRERAEFEDLEYQTIVEAGARSDSNTMYNVGLQVGSGSKVSAVKREFGEGSPLITNNPYDMMIRGEGFFGIMMPDGSTTFTRDGSFSVNYQGQIVSKKGYRLFPGIQLPPNIVSVAISETGVVEAYLRNQREPINVGTIPIFVFINPPGLKSIGGNMFRDTRASGNAIQLVAGQENAGQVVQGSLESSNVSVMNEMTQLIKAQRTFEMNSKVMGVADQMLQTVNNIR